MQPGAERPDVDHDERSNLLPHIGVDAVAFELRKAWATYFALALLPPGAMITAIFFLIFRGGDAVLNNDGLMDGFWGMTWLIVGMIWIGAALPAGFFARRVLWHRFYEGGVVEPRRFLPGCLVVWAPLVLAGVMGFVGFALTREAGVLLVSMLAFIVFLAMFPNGHSMTRPVGAVDDPGVYEEPK